MVTLSGVSETAAHKSRKHHSLTPAHAVPLAAAELGARRWDGLARRGDWVGGVDEIAAGREGGVGEHAALAADLLLLRPALAAVAGAGRGVLVAVRRGGPQKLDVAALPPLRAQSF